MIYRTLFYVNIYGSYELVKTVRFFWPTLYIVVLLGNMCVCHLYNKTYLLAYLLNDIPMHT